MTVINYVPSVNKGTLGFAVLLIFLLGLSVNKISPWGVAVISNPAVLWFFCLTLLRTKFDQNSTVSSIIIKNTFHYDLLLTFVPYVLSICNKIWSNSVKLIVNVF